MVPEYDAQVRKARKIQKLDALSHRLQAFTRPSGSKKDRHVEMIPTPAGEVKTILYGFGSRETRPVFFDLHGGGFLLGCAEMDEPMNLYLTGHVDCRIISIEYAKAPDHPFPAAVNQVYEVIRHFLANAGNFGIDPGLMAIGGHSAGANLATVTCLKAAREGGPSFRCQILDYPPLDLSKSPFDKPGPKGCIPPDMAAMFDACYIASADPADPYISPLRAPDADLKKLPPALLILAGMDSLHDEGLEYARRLESNGVEVECHGYPEAVHGFTYNPGESTSRALEQMADFLMRHFA